MSTRLAATLAVLLTPALAAPQVRAQQPFAFEDVDFTAECLPNPAFARLLGLLLSGAAGSEPAFDAPLYAAVSANAAHVLTLDRPAPWHGLRLVEVLLFHGIERGPANYTLVFAEGPEQVRTVWNARGWRLPPAGEIRQIDDRMVGIGIVAEGLPARSAVTCFHD